MRNFILSCFIILLNGQLQLSAQTRTDSIREKLISRTSSSVAVVAHRGDWRNHPENSLAAIESVIQMGVDIVELDIQRTKDNVLILMHDETLDRTTTGKGYVSKISMDSISKLHLRNGCAIRTPHKVPTLEEALLHAKGRVMINLDKADRFFNEVVALLQKTGTTKQIIMKGTQPVSQVKNKFGEYLNDIIYMPIINLDSPNAEKQIDLFYKELNPVAFELLFAKDNNPLPFKINQKLKGKSLIWYNTLWDTMAGGHDDELSLHNPDSGYGYLIDRLGACIIQTDRPAFLLDYLRSRGLHD